MSLDLLDIACSVVITLAVVYWKDREVKKEILKSKAESLTSLLDANFKNNKVKDKIKKQLDEVKKKIGKNV